MMLIWFFPPLSPTLSPTLSPLSLLLLCLSTHLHPPFPLCPHLPLPLPSPPPKLPYLSLQRMFNDYLKE